jgi:hypothetical protein
MAIKPECRLLVQGPIKVYSEKNQDGAMIMTLPIKHLSARVPWHDNKWNGTSCCNSIDNSFCRILPRVDDAKDSKKETAGSTFDESNFPSCIEEGGAFLSPNQYSRKLIHKLKNVYDIYSEYRPGTFVHKPFSYPSVPYFWMMKSANIRAIIMKKTHGFSILKTRKQCLNPFMAVLRKMFLLYFLCQAYASFRTK